MERTDSAEHRVNGLGSRFLLFGSVPGAGRPSDSGQVSTGSLNWRSLRRTEPASEWLASRHLQCRDSPTWTWHRRDHDLDAAGVCTVHNMVTVPWWPCQRDCNGTCANDWEPAASLMNFNSSEWRANRRWGLARFGFVDSWTTFYSVVWLECFIWVKLTPFKLMWSFLPLTIDKSNGWSLDTFFEMVWIIFTLIERYN